MLNQNPEQIARDNIDKQLFACGWMIQDNDVVLFSDYPPIILRHNAICEYFVEHLSEKEINAMMIFPDWLEARKQDLLNKSRENFKLS